MKNIRLPLGAFPRETVSPGSFSVLIFAGLLILKEKGSAPKYIGMALIFAGLICVALG